MKPSTLLPKEGTFGVWFPISDNGKCVEIICDPSRFYIGHNPTNNMRFCDPAVSVSKDGKILLQYSGPDGQKGEPLYKEVCPKVVRDALMTFLATIKASVEV